MTPTFLICSERSGSNLIRVMLDAHSQVHAPTPINLGRDFWYSIYRYGDLSDDANWRTLVADVVQRFRRFAPALSFDVTADELLAAVTERSFAALYEYIHVKGMRAAGKSCLFLKENHVARYIGLYLDRYPDAKFVYQVRDPRDYLTSCMGVADIDPLYRWIGGAIRVWREDQEAALNAAFTLGPRRVFTQRYEDLLREPHAVLEALCAFLDLPFEPAMLEYFERAAARQSARQRPGFWQNLSRPLMTGNIGKYRTQLGRTAWRTTEHRLRDLMVQLGYEPELPRPGRAARLRIQLSALWDRLRSAAGVAIAARRGRIDPSVGDERLTRRSPHDARLTYSYARADVPVSAPREAALAEAAPGR